MTEEGFKKMEGADREEEIYALMKRQRDESAASIETAKVLHDGILEAVTPSRVLRVQRQPVTVEVWRGIAREAVKQLREIADEIERNLND